MPSSKSSGPEPSETDVEEGEPGGRAYEGRAAAMVSSDANVISKREERVEEVQNCYWITAGEFRKSQRAGKVPRAREG